MGDRKPAATDKAGGGQATCTSRHPGIGMKSQQTSTKASQGHISEPRLAAPWGVSLGLDAAAPAGLPSLQWGQCDKQKERVARLSVSCQQGLRALSASCDHVAQEACCRFTLSAFLQGTLSSSPPPSALPVISPRPRHTATQSHIGHTFAVSTWPLTALEFEDLH